MNHALTCLLRLINDQGISVVIHDLTASPPPATSFIAMNYHPKTGAFRRFDFARLG
jgi:hypothetical protein